jgi:hypothetical protein
VLYTWTRSNAVVERQTLSSPLCFACLRPLAFSLLLLFYVLQQGSQGVFLALLSFFLLPGMPRL